MRKSNSSTCDRRFESQKHTERNFEAFKAHMAISPQASSRDQWTLVGLTIVFLNVKGKTIKIGIKC